MNRSQLQQLAEQRVRDAEALLDAGHWSGAYYLAGYAVECGLKACIAKLTNQYDFPRKDIALKSYTHNLEALLRVAELKVQFAAAVSVNPNFEANWQVVKDWREDARYAPWTEFDARTLFNAITDSTDGVLPWIQGHW